MSDEEESDEEWRKKLNKEIEEDKDTVGYRSILRKGEKHILSVEDGKIKKKVIREATAINGELDDREISGSLTKEDRAKLQARALKRFMNLQDKASKMYPQDAMKIDTMNHEELDAYLKEKERKGKQGKASMTSVGSRQFDTEGFEQDSDLLDKLYHVAYYASNSEVTPEDKHQAKQKIKQIWQALTTGEGKLLSKANREQFWKATRQYLDQWYTCGRCLKMFKGDEFSTCPHCGYNAQEEFKNRGAWTEK